ncbi:MAG: DUF373 family protein [Candidatus Micrarchaeaceae archaeon]
MEERSKEERILILVVDIDNDLFKKTKIRGPLVGRVQNLNGALSLALADPEDTDANTMFYAVKLFDEMKKEGYTVNVATITGAEDESYYADKEIARQLELVMKTFRPDACIFVSDGASDYRVMPIIQSRLKVNGVRNVKVKQAEGLETTYFTLLEKLKEPHYARIVFGIPAILLLLFSLSYIFGLGWEFPVGIIGLYLLIKGFGLEERLIDSARNFGFSLDRFSFLMYFGSIVFFVITVFVGLSAYFYSLQQSKSVSVSLSDAIESALTFVPIVLLLYLVGRIIDVRVSRQMFKSYKYSVYAVYSVFGWLILFYLVLWLAGNIYFGQFISYSILSFLGAYLCAYLINFLKRKAILSKKLKDKLLVNEMGATIGKIGGIDIKRSRVIVETPFGNKIYYALDRIIDISENVVIR